MRYEQVYELANTATSEVLGLTAVLKEDLSNVVDIGTELQNTFGDKWTEHAYGAMNDVIGRYIVVNRPYSAPILSVILKDSWIYGSAMRKTDIGLMDAEKNVSWELEVGKSVDPNLWYGANVVVKFYNKKEGFEIPLSVTDIQIREAFASGDGLAAFVSALYARWEMSLDVKLAELCRRVLNNQIAETVYDDYKETNGNLGDLTAKTGVKAINLLKMYNDQFGTNITPAVALTTPDFIRYVSMVISNTKDKMSELSTLFNIDGRPRHTMKNSEYLKIVMHSEFESAAKAYLYSDTFHENFVQLGDAVTVPYFQGTGTTYSFADTSKIMVTTASGHDVTVPNILCVMFDRDSCMVSCLEKRIKSNYVPRQEFTNSWAKVDVGLLGFNDENFVVFFMA